MYDETNMPIEPKMSIPEIDDFSGDAYYNYISAQVILPRGDAYEWATVLWYKHNNEGYLIGHKDENPLLDTQRYEVKFPNGHVGEYSTNIIEERIFSAVDKEGHEILLFQDIVWILIHNGNKVPRQMTKGCNLSVDWKDKSTS